MRVIGLSLFVLAGGISAAAGTVVPKTPAATPESVAAPTSGDALLAPGDPDFVIELITREPEQVIQLGPVPRDDCYRGNLYFSDAESGATSSTPCP
jgi:hypothetical protein